MELTILPKFSEIPAKGSPIGLERLLQFLPVGDRGLVFGRSQEDGIPLGKIPGYWTCPYNGKITGVILNTDQGGYTVKFWKSLLRSPTVDDSISINGYSIPATKTHLEIIDLSDFREVDVVTGETFAVEIVAVEPPNPTDIAGNVVILKVEEEEK